MCDRKESKQLLQRWMHEHATGERVLAVGGEASDRMIQFAREAKQLLYIDEDQAQIDRAHEFMRDEKETTKQSATFVEGSLLTHEWADQVFDSILFDQRLQTVTEPARYVQKAASLLHPNGQIIVTLPFGVDPSNDAIQPYYLSKLDALTVDGLTMVDVVFIETSIGIMFKQENAGEAAVDLQAKWPDVEAAFGKKEMTYQQALEEKAEELERLDDRKRTTGDDKRALQQDHLATQKTLLAAYQKEEDVLVEYKKLLKKYEALSTSKLGKLTLAYWKWRGRRRTK